MSDELLEMLQAVFDGDAEVQVYTMDEDGIHPLNKAAAQAVTVERQVWHLVDDAGEQYAVDDTLVDPDGDLYRLTKGDPPTMTWPKDGHPPRQDGLGRLWVTPLHDPGVEIEMAPSIFNLKFIYNRSV